MIRSLLALMVLAQAVAANPAADLRRIEDSAQLAEFMYRSGTLSARDLLNGIRSTDRLRIRPYTVEIPVREIYGTIVYERLQVQLGEDFLGPERKLEVREICAFRGANDEVWRYHILMFSDAQYDRMAAILQSKRATGSRRQSR